MKLAGAGQLQRVIGVDQLPAIGSYFSGNDRKQWCTDVPHCARIQYGGVYPGGGHGNGGYGLRES